jgi:hypothetical protein
VRLAREYLDKLKRGGMHALRNLMRAGIRAYMCSVGRI